MSSEKPRRGEGRREIGPYMAAECRTHWMELVVYGKMG